MNSDKSEAAGGDLASDLAYVRTLAEEGAHAPLIGGRYYLIWGALIGLAALLSYFDQIDVINLGGVGGFAPWLIAGVTGWVLSFTVGKRAAGKPGAQTIGNKTALNAWFGVGIFITIFFATMFFAHNKFTAYGVPPYFLFSMMFPVSFGVYGVAFFATASASRLSWLIWFAVLSWGFSAACLLMLASPHQTLLGALGSFFCAALPGLILMRNEPSDIV